MVESAATSVVLSPWIWAADILAMRAGEIEEIVVIVQLHTHAFDRVGPPETHF